MTDTVIIKELSVSDMLSIVHELKTVHKMMLNVDFTFAYHQAVDEYMTGFYQPRYTEFIFKDPKFATFFRLKYAT